MVTIVHNNGAIAQLGERLHGMQEVRGSIPLGSTTLKFPPIYPKNSNLQFDYYLIHHMKGEALFLFNKQRNILGIYKLSVYQKEKNLVIMNLILKDILNDDTIKTIVGWC